MYNISESEIIFILDLIQEVVSSGEVHDELTEAEDLLQSILANPQLEVAS